MGVDFSFESRTFLREEVLEVLKKCWLKDFANPMSAYQFGARAKYIMELSRERIGKFLNIDRNDIFFVASRDEALAWIQLLNESLNLHWPIQKLNQESVISELGSIIDIEGSFKFLPLKEEFKNIIYFGSFREIGGPRDGYFVSIPSHLPGIAFIHGGHQERARRAGTQNIPSIAGMDKAIYLYQMEKVELIDKWYYNFQKIKNIISLNSKSLMIEESFAYFDFLIPETQIENCILRLEEEGIHCEINENRLRLWVPYELKDEELCFIKQLIQIIEESYE